MIDFGRKIAALQDQALGDRGFAAAARPLVIAAADARPAEGLRRRRRRRLIVVASLACALPVGAAAGVAFLMTARAPAPIAFQVGGRPGEPGARGWLAAPDASGLPLEFSDGSRVVLSARARARVAGVDAHGAHLLVERGHAEIAVVHRPDSHWSVDIGPFEVAVVGTHFDISWDPNEEVFALTLRQGKVTVSGGPLGQPGRALAAGETLNAWSRQDRFEITHEGPGAVRPASGTGAGGAAAAESPTTEPAVAPSETEPPTWRELGRRRAYGQALKAARAAGFARLCQSASSTDLMLLGDLARYAGDLDRGEAAYQALRRRFPRDVQAPLAALALGRMAFDQRRDYAAAAVWLSDYLREAPRGALGREAAGRLMEAFQNAHQPVRAREAARSYLARYPDGPHAPLARSLLRE